MLSVMPQSSAVPLNTLVENASCICILSILKPMYLNRSHFIIRQDMKSKYDTSFACTINGDRQENCPQLAENYKWFRFTGSTKVFTPL